MPLTVGFAPSSAPLAQDAAITTVHTWCSHQDASAFIKPLYNVMGDDIKTVVQVGLEAWPFGISLSWGQGSGRHPA